MTTASTNATFYVNTTPSTFDEAQLACRYNGGSLAVFTSLEEQQVGWGGVGWGGRGWLSELHARAASCPCCRGWKCCQR
jgi:hypothetical protein